MKLISAVALALFLTSTEAFGPAVPVNGNSFGVSSSASNGMTMRVSVADRTRRQKFNKLLADAGGKATKEAIEQQLVTKETEAILDSVNWKVRKTMMRKINHIAYKYDVAVDSSFGLPPTQTEREAAEAIAGAERNAARAARMSAESAEAASAKAAREAKKAASKAKNESQKAAKKSAPAAAAPAPAAPAAEAAPASAPAAAGGEVTPKTIKALRDATGAGMMDCKGALLECNGDQEAATELLRSKGLAKADKKAARVAAEGKIATASAGGKTVLVEVNCETDFVGKDSSFLSYCNKVAGAAANVADDNVETLMNQEVDGESLEATRQALVSKIGENIQVRRLLSRGGAGTTVGAYVHMNRIGVLVELEGGTPELCTDVAMHVAAMNPPFATPEDVPQDVLEKEKNYLSEQALESGKPPEIVEKMVEGRIRKYLEEICLVSQNYVKDGDKTVGQLLAANDAKMVGFTRIEVGEGIEKRADDFAAEVAAMAGGK